MALKDITQAQIMSFTNRYGEGFMSTEVRGWDVFITGNRHRGYKAKITLLWDADGSDAHVDMEDEIIGDTIAELKEEIMYAIKHLGRTAAWVKRKARKYYYTGDIEGLEGMVEAYE
jgi:hypothetical protein